MNPSTKAMSPASLPSTLAPESGSTTFPVVQGPPQHRALKRYTPPRFGLTNDACTPPEEENEPLICGLASTISHSKSSELVETPAGSIVSPMLTVKSATAMLFVSTAFQ